MVMNSKVRAEYDAATATLLRDLADGAETGVDTDAETGVSLNKLTSAYWDNNDQPNGLLAFNVLITALDLADLDETYTLIWEACTDSSGSGAKEIARLIPTSTGFYQAFAAAETIKKILSTATHVRVKCTKTGTTPSITYGCWASFKGAV